jgi:hypothetical protein
MNPESPKNTSGTDKQKRSDPGRRFMLISMAVVTLVILLIQYGIPMLMSKTVTGQDTVTLSDGTTLSCTVSVTYPKNTNYNPLAGFVTVKLENGKHYQYELTGQTRWDGDYCITSFLYVNESTGEAARGSLCYCPETEAIAIVCKDNDLVFVPEAIANAAPVTAWLAGK